MDREPFVAEIQSVNRHPRLILTRFYDMDPLIVGDGIFVDNSYMVGSNLDLKDLFIILLRCSNEPFIAELQSVNRRPRMILSRYYDKIDAITLGDSVFVDNPYVCGSNIKLVDVLYRLSRTVGQH